MTDPDPYPEEWCDSRITAVRLRALRRINQELARYVRAQRTIDDIKRRCGVTTREDPPWNGN